VIRTAKFCWVPDNSLNLWALCSVLLTIRFPSARCDSYPVSDRLLDWLVSSQLARCIIVLNMWSRAEGGESRGLTLSWSGLQEPTMQFTFCTQAILLSAVTQVIFVWVLFHLMQNDDDAACQCLRYYCFLCGVNPWIPRPSPMVFALLIDLELDVKSVRIILGGHMYWVCSLSCQRHC
jgi:hypothetical protein